MKIVLTGSVGNISKPLAEELIKKGHSVTVISSHAEREKDIRALGADAAIGSIDDVLFLAKTFTGADAVYCMTPPDFSQPDQVGYYERVANSYAKAIRQSGTKRVLYLSSYGAHLEKGTGFITGSYKSEKILNALPDISLTHIRPTYFYYNLFPFIRMIKSTGFIGAVYGGEDKLAMVSPKDIASAIANEITKPGNFQKICYVGSDDRTCNEIASVLGNAIGIQDLKWIALPPAQVMQSLLNAGIPENAAMNLVELSGAIHNGILREDYDRHQRIEGKIKLEDFANEFAIAYNR